MKSAHKKEFIMTSTCNFGRTQLHCQRCRDIGTAGQHWRASHQIMYALPDNDDVNFQCPFGMSWNAQESEVKLIGDILKEVTSALGIPTCASCEDRREFFNAVHLLIKNKLREYGVIRG